MTLTLLSFFAAPVFAGEVPITGVSATSTFPPEAGAVYSAAMVKDRKLASSWVEGSGGAGLGQSITLELENEVKVSEVHVWGGMWYSAEFWDRANRPREVEVKLADGTKSLCKMTDEMSVQVCKFETPTASNTVQLVLKGAYSGTTWTDTAISEIKVYDDQDRVWLTPGEVTASSVLPDDGDGPYDAKNASDGFVDSFWCEGNEEGDGTAEWLQIDFGGEKKVNSLEVYNGIASGLLIYKKGNRVATATLGFSDGSTKKVTFQDTYRQQTIPVGKTTSFVKITVDTIVKGSKYNDLCISSVRAK